MVGELAEVKGIIRSRVLSIPEVTAVTYREKEQRVVITVESEEAVPKVRRVIPDIIAGYEVVIEVMRRPEAFWDRKAKWRPVVGGVSIGHYKISTGTNASRVYDAGGNRTLLSNAHVFTPIAYDGSWGSRGDTISQPGPYDVGFFLLDKAAELSRWVELTKKGPNFVDAAVATPTVGITDSILGEEPEEWVVTEAVKVEEGLRVKKAGRTTGVTHGVVKYTDVDVKVHYGSVAGDFTFTSQVLIEDERGDKYDFSSPGDSGSLIVTEDGERAVALLFAGSTGPSRTIACPIGYVMHLLKIGFSYPLQAPPQTPPIPSWWVKYGPKLKTAAIFGAMGFGMMVLGKPTLEEGGLI